MVLVLESHRVKGVAPDAGVWVKVERVAHGCFLVCGWRPEGADQSAV
jgi:hypothetical protein